MTTSTFPNETKVPSVSELTRAIKLTLEEGFRDVWVAGEISNLSRPASGHIYFALKDAEAQLSAVVWRSAAYRVRVPLKDGMQVIVRGRLTVYPPRGSYQITVEELQPKGLGARELALRELKEKLQRLGYFAPERKKPLPGFPRRLALVTSPTGAAVRDMLEILGQRWPAVEVLVCPVRVQGDGAAQEIAGALRTLNHLHQTGALRLDVMILGRGGGSTEDLWAFNEEVVAQAIFNSLIPIVSAVGHEIDLTVADLVADRRAVTPTEAATVVVPDQRQLRAGLDDCQRRMRQALVDRLAWGTQRLDDFRRRRCFRAPLDRIRSQEQRLDELGDRLKRAARQRLSQATGRLEALAAQLESLSPLNVLSRGYSLTRKYEDQAVVRSPEQVQPGDRLLTTVAHGSIVSRVEERASTASPPAAGAQGCPSAARMHS